jgi:hypothetical protein
VLTTRVWIALVGGTSVVIVARDCSVVTSGFRLAAIAIAIVYKAGYRNGGTSIDRFTRIDSTFVASLTLLTYINKNASNLSVTSVVRAHVVIIALVRYVGIDTTEVGTTRVRSASVVIVAVNQSVNALSRIIVARIDSTEVVIVTIDWGKDTSNSAVTSINSACIVVITSYLLVYTTIDHITAVIGTFVVVVAVNGSMDASSIGIATVVSASVVIVTRYGWIIASTSR